LALTYNGIAVCVRAAFRKEDMKETTNVIKKVKEKYSTIAALRKPCVSCCSSPAELTTQEKPQISFGCRVLLPVMFVIRKTAA